MCYNSLGVWSFCQLPMWTGNNRGFLCTSSAQFFYGNVWYTCKSISILHSIGVGRRGVGEAWRSPGGAFRRGRLWGWTLKPLSWNFPSSWNFSVCLYVNAYKHMYMPYILVWPPFLEINCWLRPCIPCSLQGIRLFILLMIFTLTGEHCDRMTWHTVNFFVETTTRAVVL